MAEADISNDLQNTSAALGNFQTSLNSLASSMTAQEVVAGRLAKAEEKRFKDISKGLGNAAKKMGDVGKKLGIVAGISFSMKGVLDILLKVERSMQKFAKQMGTTAGNVDKLFRLTTKVEKDFNKMGMSLDDAMHASGAIAQEFGRTSKVTDGMIKTVGKLNKAFGIGIGEAAAFTERMTEAGYEITSFTQTLAKESVKAGTNLGVVFRDVVKNVGMMELYAGRSAEDLAKMATAAAGLGVSMDVFGKAAGAWKDFDQMSETIGQAAIAFGAGFEKALPGMREMRDLWNQMEDVKLMEHTTKALAGQMELRIIEGQEVLINKRTGLKLSRDELEIMTKLYNGELEFGKRSVKQQLRFEKFLKDRDKLGKQYSKYTKEQFVNLNDAVRAINKGKGLSQIQGKNEEDRLEIMKEVLILAEEEQKRRTELAKQQDIINEVIQSGMGFLERFSNELTAAIQPFITSISQMFSDDFLNKHVIPMANKMGAYIRGALDQNTPGGAFNLTEIFAELQSEGGFMKVVKKLATGVGNIFKDGLIWAFSLEKEGAKDAEQSWGDIAQGILGKITATLDEGSAEVQEIIRTYLKPVWEETTKYLDEELPGRIIQVVNDMSDAVRTTLIGAFNVGKPVTEQLSKDTGWSGFFERLKNDASKSLKEGLIKAFDLKDTEYAEDFMGPTPAKHMEQSLGNVMMTVGRKLVDAVIEQFRAQTAAIAAIFSNIFAQAWENFSVTEAIFGSALGRSGGRRHVGLVGEAGTEVGIKRSALRELSSAGIPGYKQGFVSAATNTEGLYGSAGAVRLREDRQADAQRAGERYRNPIRNMEQSFLNIENNTKDLSQGKSWWTKVVTAGLKDDGVMAHLLTSIASTQDKLLAEDKKQTVLTKSSVALLGGVGSALDAMSMTLRRGGSSKEAREMGKRGLVSGIVRDLSSSFGGTANVDYLQTQSALGAVFAAKGRVFDRPTLAMVGEGGANEIVIPTERIRKGLPINAGVAKELASIGVPGFQDGGEVEAGGPADSLSLLDKQLPKISISDLDQVAYHDAGPAGGPISDDVFSMQTRDAAAGGGGLPSLGGPSQLSKMGGGIKSSYDKYGGWQSGVATAGLSFAQSYMQTGDAGYAAGQALGSAIGLGATMAISAIPVVGPVIGPILGPLIGGFIGSKLGKKFMYKPKYKKFQKRALKNVEDLVASQGQFMHGQPPGIKSQIEKGYLGGKKKHPSEKEYEKLIDMFSKSPVLSYGFGPGHSASQLLALLSGQVGNTGEELEMYKRYNNVFYGTPMAKGGIVTGPTQAVIGEKGPEAVIPLDQHGGYASRQQMQDQKDIIGELRKQNQQFGMFIKNMGESKTVLNVDGRTLAETVGQNMYDINTGM